MQLDSHMSFDLNWDTELIKMLHSCDAGEYSVLTTYAPSFTEEKQDDGSVKTTLEDIIVSRRWHRRSESGMAHCGGSPL